MVEAPAGFRPSPAAVLPMTQPIPHLEKEDRKRYSVGVRVGGEGEFVVRTGCIGQLVDGKLLTEDRRR